MRGITTLAALLLAFCILIRELHCLSPEASVVDFLLKSYNTNGRPVSNFSKPVTVRMNPAFHQLINLDERDELMETNVWMRLSWHDDYLTWNETDFGGVNKVRIFPNQIWKPDIILSNQISKNHDDFSGIFPAIVSSNGSVTWFSQRIFKTACSIDVAQFPWDTQNCKMSFLSWTYDIKSLDLVPESHTGDTLGFVPNGQWVLDKIPVTRTAINYPCCPNPFVTVEYTLILNRKPLYYVVNLVVPCIFITLVGIMVFCLPAESGEKVSLSVTVLLSATVFLLILSDALPAQSEVVPQAAQFFLAVIIFMSLSTICTVVVLNVHSRGRFGHRVPGPIRRLFFKRFEKIKASSQAVYRSAGGEPNKSGIHGKRRYSIRRKSLLLRSAACDMTGLNSGRRRSSAQSAGGSGVDQTRSVSTCLQTQQSPNVMETGLPNSPGSVGFENEAKIRYGLDTCEIQSNVAENQHIIEREWMYLASLVDNALFVIFLIGIFVVSVVILWSRAA